MNSHKASAVGATWAVFTWPSQTAVSNKSVQTGGAKSFPSVPPGAWGFSLCCLGATCQAGRVSGQDV